MKNLGIKSQKFIDAAKRFHGGDRSLQVLQDIKYGHSSRPLADIWIDDINAWRILPRLNWIKKNLQNFNKNIKILDVGSWTGVFANEIYKEGFGNITCLDISKNVCSFGEKAFPHLNFICEDIEDFTTSEKYDLILLCEILEHITEPIKTLKKISQLLTENGSILSTIPDENYVEYDFSRGFVEHFNPIPKKKLSIFSPNIETLPIFDDYYWYCLNFSPTIQQLFNALLLLATKTNPAITTSKNTPIKKTSFGPYSVSTKLQTAAPTGIPIEPAVTTKDVAASVALPV